MTKDTVTNRIKYFQRFVALWAYNKISASGKKSESDMTALCKLKFKE